ncbi:hypothetical protein F4808DRAFT_447328, partial [Astrocystis sublimbata]
MTCMLGSGLTDLTIWVMPAWSGYPQTWATMNSADGLNFEGRSISHALLPVVYVCDGLPLYLYRLNSHRYRFFRRLEIRRLLFMWSVHAWVVG